MKRRTSKYLPQKGFSIVELLIAVMIIGILASILVPTVSRRADEGRMAAALSDLERLTDAEERFATDVGYYARLYMLDNTAWQVADDRDDTDRTDAFINMNTHELLTQTAALNVFEVRLEAETEYARVWSGPYVTIHSDQDEDQDNDPDDGLHVYGIPNDPWGNDYLLVLRSGVVVEPDGTIETTFNGDSVEDVDRPAIVSLGPDGIPGSTGSNRLGAGDDIVRKFGY